MVSEFNLAYNDSIVARVLAVNAAGLKGEYKESNEDAKVKTKPEKMAEAPVWGKSTDSNTLHITWKSMDTLAEKGGSEIIYYSVFTEGATDPIYSTSEDFYLYEQVGTETEMKFTVAATNIYGTGAQSDLCEAIQFGAVPSTLQNLSSENGSVADNGDGAFKWDAPSDTTVDGYKFEILNLNNNTYEPADETNAMTNALADWLSSYVATFDCQNLVENFGYQHGDKISFRVAVKNSFGYSEWAYPTLGNMNAVSFNMLIL